MKDLANRVCNSLKHRIGKYVLSEKKFVEMHSSYCLGYKVNLDNPQTFNEKLNWMKVYGRDPKYTIMADKYAAKKYVADIIGEQYVVPCLGVYKSFDEIDFSLLPNQFVLKPTHQSGVVVCKDKSSLDIEAARKKLESDLKRNYYTIHREWVYKDIPPRIIADTYLDDHTGTELRDYKFWCFNGEPKVIYLTNKGANVYENFYDMDFNPLHIDHGFARHQPEFACPNNFALMKELATKLSEGIPFVRIDFFDVDDKVYFGECTFYDWGGCHPFASYEEDLRIGEWLILPQR